MDDVMVPPANGLSQTERLVDTFVAPSKTFTDILRSASWWLPFLIVFAVSMVFTYVILHKIGLATLVDGVVRQNGMLEDRLANATPAEAAHIRGQMEMQFKFMWVAPVFLLAISAIVSGIFLATANFVFGGKAKYSQMFAVWIYGTFPLIFVSILTIVTAYAGVGTDQFNIKNAVGTNIGYYLQGGSTPHWLVTLLTSFDVFAIWSAILLTIGISIVAGIKRSSAAIVVFGLWALYVLGQTAIAAITG